MKQNFEIQLKLNYKIQIIINGHFCYNYIYKFVFKILYKYFKIKKFMKSIKIIE